MTQHKQPDGLEPGIYFNLPENAYHSDSALSHGGMVYLLKSWYDYWENSTYNPERENEPTEAMKFGTQCHEFLLNEKDFFRKYCVAGSKTWTKDKVTMASHQFKKVKRSIDEIKAVQGAYAYFTNGMPEVTIIIVCPITGIRLRIRIDYLRFFGGIDYKRCKSIEDNQLGWFIADHGYDIQQVLYQDVILEAKRLLRAGKIKLFGTHDLVWLKKFADNESAHFRFFFQRSMPPYIFTIKNMDDDILSNARVAIEDAKDRYLKWMAVYGIAKPPAGNADTTTLSMYHMPRRIIDRGAQP